MKGCVLIAFTLLSSAIGLAQEPQRKPDVPFVATRGEVIDAMLDLGRVKREDVVYDLGCGDGRILIAAALNRGARGVGIDIDPQLVREARAQAEKAGVTDKVEFIEGDLFEAKLDGATVVMLYLTPQLNMRLRPKLLRELRPGTRIVSHNYNMGDWKPEQQAQVGMHTVYLWTVPREGDHPVR
jgi:SAM-dependent methyltransferase